MKRPRKTDKRQNPSARVAHRAITKANRKAFSLPTIDNDPEIRRALVARITALAERAPITLLHQIAQMVEMAADQ